MKDVKGVIDKEGWPLYFTGHSSNLQAAPQNIHSYRLVMTQALVTRALWAG
jgi:hypothetical protein